MQRLLILGAGDLGRELFGWITGDQRHGRDFEVAGFLDDNLAALDSRSHYPTRVVGSISDYVPQPGDMLVMAISNPATKLKLAASLEGRGAEFFNYIHPTAVVSRFVTWGRGCTVCPQCVVSCDAQIGNFVTVNTMTSIGHDTQIGDGCTINAHCDLTGHVRVGTGVYFGSNACVVPSVQIGDFAKIGAGSTVIRRVQPHTTVMGATAKRIDLTAPQSDAA